MNIFVSVCSYRDPLLRNTIQSLIENRSGNHRVVIGVFEQTNRDDSLIVYGNDLLDQYECSEAERQEVVECGILYKRIDPEYSDGIGWARNICQHMMDTEKFELMYQVDSHMLFDKNWDETIVENYTEAVTLTGSKKCIITAPCKVFHFEDSTVVLYPPHEIGGMIKFQHEFQSAGIPAAVGIFTHVKETIEPANHIFAGNTVFPACWIKECGNDPEIFFDCEEHKLTLDSFDKGYQIFFAKKLYSYHFRDTGEYITKQWYNPIISTIKYTRHVQRSHQHFNTFVNLLPIETLNRFTDSTGLDYVLKEVRQQAKI